MMTIPDCQEKDDTPDQEEGESVKWSKLRIHSKRPTKPIHHRTVQEDAIEESVEEEEEAVLSLTLPQEPHVKNAATEAVAKEPNKRQEKRKPCRAKADVGLMFGVMHVHGQDPDAPTEGWAMVCTKKKRPYKQKVLPLVSEEKALQPVEVQAAHAAPKKATPVAPRRNTRRAPKAANNSVGASWKQEVLDTTLAVAPHQRRCIVGPRGATLKQVYHEFPGVRVTVPPPLDAVTDTVRMRGLPQQVAGTVARLKALLHEGEVIEAQLAVTPRQRRDVVGPAGATLRTLLIEYPDVGVTVRSPRTVSPAR